MLMPKQNRVAIYEYLFKEGVMVAKKDYHAPKHPDLEKIPNLQVIKAMQSLKSRGYVKEQFAWRHFYWYVLILFMIYLEKYFTCQNTTSTVCVTFNVTYNLFIDYNFVVFL